MTAERGVDEAARAAATEGETMRIAVIGGTGYTGGAIVGEAVRRGHAVTAWSRSVPAVGDAAPGVRYEAGEMGHADSRARAVGDNDIILSALSPRGDLVGHLVEINRNLAELAAKSGARMGVVGGFAALRVTPGGARLATVSDLGSRFAIEAREMAAVADAMYDTPTSLEWFYISPSANYGAMAPGTTTGTYDPHGDVIPPNSYDLPNLSNADFATAILDEVDNPTHPRGHFAVTATKP
jgi:putative NADH-flavin reductase